MIELKISGYLVECFSQCITVKGADTAKFLMRRECVDPDICIDVRDFIC